MRGAARTVWVTGAASGMGAAHARRFAELGDRVGCWDLQADALQAVGEEIRAGGGEAEAVVADITDADAVDAGAARLREALGPAAVVVANAGIILTGDYIEELELDSWRRVIDVNLTGAFLTCKAAIPQLREAGEGALILISSVCGLTASAGDGAGGGHRRDHLPRLARRAIDHRHGAADRGWPDGEAHLALIAESAHGVRPMPFA